MVKKRRKEDPVSVAAEMIEAGVIKQIVQDMVDRSEREILHLIAHETIELILRDTSRLLG